ncbi:MAG: tetratricopeptide repeat protein [Bacteroidetes bacterium]|nr:tetratricopeptide repeat protein [Bacteroidota bacterium]
MKNFALSLFLILFSNQLISQNALSSIKDTSGYRELRGKIANQTFFIDRDSTNFDAIVKRSNFEMQLGDYVNCVKDNNRLLQLNPNSGSAYCNRALAYCFLKEYKKAISDANKQVELEPEVAMSYYNRAYIKGEAGEYKSAIVDLDKAIAIRPDYYKAFANKGHMYSKLKNYEEAIKYYDKAISLNPNYLEPLLNRVIARYELKDYRRTISDYNKFMEVATFVTPETNDLYLMLQKAYEKIGDKENAELFKQKADAYLK